MLPATCICHVWSDTCLLLSCRVRQSGNDVVVDVRSASRVGKGDLGANAARIQKYLAAVQAELADAPAAATQAAPAAPGKL